MTAELAHITQLTDVGSPLNVAPGAIVVVRDEEWFVTNVTATQDGTLLTVTGISELVRDTEAMFYEGLDDITVADPAKTRVVADDSPGYRRAKLWLEATLRKTSVPMANPSLTVCDQMLADPLEYQLDAVRAALNPELLRPRILLADAVGLGKTIEVGMILAELVRRGRGDRILIVTPKHVLEQMQHELWTRFALPFVRLDSVGIQRVRQKLPATRNPFSLYRRAIISIDTLKNDRYLAHLRHQRWDAVVIDESHNITNSTTQNNRLAKTLAPQADALILASATPHNGNPESFAELIRLLEPSAVTPAGELVPEAVERIVVRRHRHSPSVAGVVGADWAERREPHNRLVDASPAENAIAAELADTWLWPSASQVNASGRPRDALFGWTLAKAFLSSPSALAETVQNRIKRLTNTQAGSGPESNSAGAVDAELSNLRRLYALAVEATGVKASAKYDALLDEFERIGISKTSPERVVVFAERVATLHWLRDRVATDLKLRDDQIAVLHGGLSDAEQQAVIEQFKLAGSPLRVLITGDVASEGVNLHKQCHELIHFDIPWSLIRIEQRNGRIDRYGQLHQPQITTLLLQPDHERFSGDVRVLTSLVAKEHQAHQALGDSASLMGEYSVSAEEDKVRDILAGSRQLDDVVAEPESVMDGGGVAGLLARLGVGTQVYGPSTIDPLDEQQVAAELVEPVEEPGAAAGLRSGLYDSDVDYLRDGLVEVFIQPEQPPATSGGGVSWREHQGHQLAELVPPSDLVGRLEVLPQTYLSDRKVTEQLMLATTKAAGGRELANAVSGESSSSWPQAHFLGPLHPVLLWVGDRSLATLGRGEVFAVRGSGEKTAVLMLATLHSGSGQTVSAVWSTVEFADVSSPVAPKALSHTTPGDMLRYVGLESALTNAGAPTDLASIEKLIPVAVEAASQQLSLVMNIATTEAQRRVAQWQQRSQLWIQDSLDVAQGAGLRERSKSVRDEEFVAKSRLPEQSFVRPLAVVLPHDHPVNVESTQGVR